MLSDAKRRAIRIICACAFALAACLPSCEAPAQPSELSSPQKASNEALRNGVSLAQQGKMKAAEEAFGRAVELSPRDPRALTALGQVQEQLGKYTDSIHQFREVIEIDPSSAEAHVNLAIALSDNGRLAEALEETATAIKLKANDAGAHFIRARLMSDLAKRDEAREEFAKVMRLDPHYAEALRYWAALEGDAGHRDFEAKLLSRYLKLRPDDAEALFQFGQLMLEEGHDAEAIDALKRATKVNPHFKEALYRLALAIKTTDPSESRVLLAKVEDLERSSQNDDRVRLLGNEANAKMADSDFNGAIEDIRQAIMLCGSCVHLGALRKNLGLAYCHKGELDSCVRELHVAQSLIPDDPDIPAALKVARQQLEIVIPQAK